MMAWSREEAAAVGGEMLPDVAILSAFKSLLELDAHALSEDR
jgi:hypothetical protein